MTVLRSFLPATALALALAAAAAGAADSGRATPDACKSDAASLCPGMSPGDGKFGHCMKSQRDKISEGCRTAIKHARGEHAGASAAHAGHHGASGAKAGKGGGGDGEGTDDD